MGSNLFLNISEAVAMVLFGIGFANLMFQKNLIKKIIGFNIMDTAIYLFLAGKGYIAGRMAPWWTASSPWRPISIPFPAAWF